MERFEIFNRNIGQWQVGGEIVSGWNENWVQDKTTDNMTLKLKYTGENAPDWKKGDWCRFLHLADNENSATYKMVIGNRVKQIDTLNIGISLNQIIDENQLITYTFSLSNETKQNYELLEPLSFSFEDDGVEINAGLYLPNFEYIYQTFNQIGEVTKQEGNIWVVSKQETIKIPLNHEQYVIKDVTFAKNEIAGDWDCQLTLQEPIEIANGISIETRSFTNQINKVVDGVTYTHEARNHLNVLETILKTTPANNNFNESWFSRIGIIDREFIRNISYNDETLSEQNLYGLLLDKYDSTLGRTPVLYFDIENDLPKDLTKATYILDFIRQDGFDKENVQLNDLSNNSTDYIINKSGENFSDGLISNYSNLAPNKEITFTAENLWAIPEVENNERDLTQYSTNSEIGVWIIRTPHKIKKINKLIKYHFVQFSNVEQWTKDVTEIEVLEQKQYNASNDYNTRNVDWFVEGEQKIHLNDFYYKSSNELYLYRIEYEPLINGRFDLGRDYNIQINQNDSQVDNVKYGEYLKKYLQSMNKADIIITKNVQNFSDILETGTRVIDGNKQYLITNVGIQNRDYDYTVTYQLNENHFRRNDSIVASQEIRQNIEIAVDATKERKTMLAYEYKLSTTPISIIDNLAIKEQVFSALLTSSVNKYPQTALLNIKNENKITEIQRLCDIARFILNDTMCFNITYFDNAEAGKQKNVNSNGTYIYYNGQQIGYTYLQGSPNSQIPVLYTDIFGEVPIFDVKLLQANTPKIEDVDITSFTTGQQFGEYIQDVIKQVRYASSYPSVSANFLNDFATEIENPILKIENINYYKDMLDTFNYTLGLHINSDNNIILCKGLFEDSNLMTMQPKRIALAMTFERNITESDIDTKNVQFEDAQVISTSLLSGNEITITLADTIRRNKSVLFVNSDGKPLLIINDLDKLIDTETFQSIKLYC